MNKVVSEHNEQVGFLRWFKSQFRGVLIFAIPNGGHRHMSVAKALKREGVVAGVPDLFVPAWNLWIEMKTTKGRLSKEQSVMIEYLEREGHEVLIGYGATDASEKVVSFYLDRFT